MPISGDVGGALDLVPTGGALDAVPDETAPLPQEAPTDTAEATDTFHGGGTSTYDLPGAAPTPPPAIGGFPGGNMQGRWSATDDQGNPMPGARWVTGSLERRRENIMAGIRPDASAEEHWRAQRNDEREERNAFARGPAAYAQHLHTRFLNQAMRQARVDQLEQPQGGGSPLAVGVGAMPAALAGVQPTTVDQEVASRVAAMRRTNPTGRINEAQIRHQVIGERRLADQAAQRANRPQADDTIMRRHRTAVNSEMTTEAANIRSLRSAEARENVPQGERTTLPEWMRTEEGREVERIRRINERLAESGHAPLPDHATRNLAQRQGESTEAYHRRLLAGGPGMGTAGERLAALGATRGEQPATANLPAATPAERGASLDRLLNLPTSAAQELRSFRDMMLQGTERLAPEAQTRMAELVHHAQTIFENAGSISAMTDAQKRDYNHLVAQILQIDRDPRRGLPQASAAEVAAARERTGQNRLMTGGDVHLFGQ